MGNCYENFWCKQTEENKIDKQFSNEAREEKLLSLGTFGIDEHKNWSQRDNFKTKRYLEGYGEIGISKL